ncbi:GNAT family N-acetyltransferase [Amycolatopsis sp. SID8362]|uniref:GNAT family N-acetyltransferase n=1 Tax=Amycolatopsis sp. SID8362 TaxID=2690346 RepID=UPI0013692198|nr:GNAT family N-acetyltransferase [Amycolatopsis sp. SID8362]NBH08569.1 GNAT family N-acetyltransferase [Amycolatopsis sp. SID8362]NED45263.1 GNAT family N-acetyltransferase [Amycolatopsis sp. SID8362]
MTPAAQITVADDLDDLGAAAGLLDHPANGFYSSPPWLAVCADISDDLQRYFVAGRSGRPVTTVPFVLPTDEPTVAYRPHVLYPFRQPEPYLLLGQRRGYRTHWAGEPDPAAAGALLGEAVRLAAEHGRPWVYALHLTTATADLIATGTDGDRPPIPVLSAQPECFLPAPGGSVEDYLEGVGKRRRAELLNQYRRVLRAPGIRFRAGRLADEVTALAPLALQAVARHGSPRTLADIVAELDALARYAGDIESLVVVEENGQPVGFGLWYEWQGRLWGRHAALVERLRTSATPILFHLLFRCALEICYERGLDGVHLGPTNLAAKLRRGARLEPLWHLSVCEGREVLRPENVRQATEEVLRMIGTDCGRYAPAEELAAMRRKAFRYAEGN